MLQMSIIAWYIWIYKAYLAQQLNCGSTTCAYNNSNASNRTTSYKIYFIFTKKMAKNDLQLNLIFRNTFIIPSSDAYQDNIYKKDATNTLS